jgi:hypothetical protein
MAQIVNQFSGQISARAHVEEVLKAFNEFADNDLYKWRSKPGTDGVRTFYATSTREFTYGVEVLPSSFKARIEVALERKRHFERYKLLGKPYSLKRQVGYFYKVVFMFTAVSSDATQVSYQMTEEIDHRNALVEDLVNHYAVPSLPEPRNQIGETFLEITKTLP